MREEIYMNDITKPPRTIKFRAWDSYQNKMFSWSKLGELDEAGHLSLWNTINNLVDHIKPIQYTGFHDKNGIEIYEGDIVKTPYDFNSGSFHDPVGCFGVWAGEVKLSPHHGAHVRKALVWDEADMSDDLTKLPPPIIQRSTWRVRASKCEVIGNIHENPELLEGVESE